jgi:protein-tyrosine phosphatase
VLPPYEQQLPAGARRVAIPVADFSVPPEEAIVQALDAVDDAVAQERSVYVHCWGGRGRTGTVVGSWLVRHGATGEEALRRVAELRGAGPETAEQRQAVLGWRRGR